jgi:DNA-binding transcriptional LysR family regulator
MNTNLLHLYYFYQVAKAGSITSASLLLNIQQPALSIMLKKFEANTGFPVFEKKGRRIQLTEKGRELYAYAEEVFVKVQKLEEFVGQKSDEISGKIKIATNDLIAHYILGPILADWLKKYPAAQLSIQYMSAQEACEKMTRDEIDYGLFFYGPEEMSGIEIEKLKKISFVCAAHKRSVENFIGSREVDYSLTRKLPTYEKLKKIFPEIRVQLNTNGLMLHKDLAIKGAGAVVLPIFAIKEELKKKQLINLLPSEKLEFSIKLYQRKNKILSTTQDLFLEDVINVLNKV